MSKREDIGYNYLCVRVLKEEVQALKDRLTALEDKAESKPKTLEDVRLDVIELIESKKIDSTNYKWCFIDEFGRVFVSENSGISNVYIGNVNIDNVNIDNVDYRDCLWRVDKLSQKPET